MASINDYKILNKKCYKQFEILNNILNLDVDKITDANRYRFGFYLFFLDFISDGADSIDLVECITDTDFNKIIFNDRFDDYGIDAIYINEEDRTINLCNFKYRENYKPNSSQKENDVIVSSKFINALMSGNTDSFKNKKYNKLVCDIINNLNSNDVWKMNLYVVSNDNNEINTNNEHIKNMQEMYDLDVIPIGLPYISSILSIRPKPINSALILDSNALMSYEEHELNSNKSYIARLKSSDIVRITCNDSQLREDYSLEDLSKLAKADLEYSVLFDNVRGFVLKSKFNDNILKSLRETPEKFFMYNNGITIIAESIDVEGVNGNKKQKIKLNDFQIINGGQTLRTIHNFNKQDDKNISEYLCDSEVLVRIFHSKKENNSTNKIAEYTNSQNSISPRDLKSLSSEQIELEKYLKEYSIIYSRKSGDVGYSDVDIKDIKYKISMEKLGQILTAVKIGPDKSSNHKKLIFTKYYDDLFVNNFNIEDIPELISIYYNVINEYAQNEKSNSLEQKYYYIIYMKWNDREAELSYLIDFLDEAIDSYVAKEGTSDARKLIQINFKKHLDTLMERN
ncbi:AIPR family protein [Providencia stuartii]|uniref:AIPR family protein n=2 Tax=Providencia TaxID=586 RepID=A0AAI9GD97_PROST|nr:AIPR family protein [Providencia sp. 2023EL-00965]ELR5111684.1 AIPR family protein [Providencia stuartii]ELR5299126.1 AIPR family protein [Providencia stuartii]MDW7587419.1 AIPR family protein [Providencia sp. 2023EL-00965]